MKQIVDKLNKIAKKIDESVEIPQTDLIIDSLDAITKAYGGTPNDSNLIVDKLEDIYNNIEPAVSGNIEITENGENINVAPYATATVNVSGGGDNIILPMTEVTWDGTIPGGQLYTDPDMTGVSANEQVIIRLNYIDEETSEFILLGSYDATAGPTMEDFSGITEGDPAVSIAIRHVTDRPNEPWFLVVSVGGEPMGGTYQVGICKDIPHEVA